MEPPEPARSPDADPSPRNDPPDASPPAPPPPRATGPRELAWKDKRPVYVVVPPAREKPQRLLAMLHGMCNPPGYACGYWTTAAAEQGFLVCPTGNASCGPGMYNAPTWTENDAKIDEDLEASIQAVTKAFPNEIARDGAVLAGFSRGASAAVAIARSHPGRWPYLLLNEMAVPLSADAMKKCGVRAVALVAGEIGANVAYVKTTQAALEKGGVPARAWIMPKAGHHYSANIDDIMREAVSWLVEH